MMEEEKKDLTGTEKRETEDKNANMGLILGLCLGSAIGAATNNIGLWLCLGVCFGLIYDSWKKKQDETKDDGEDPQA